jgi:hypothetical protein
MRMKKQVLMAMFCAFSLLSNSAAVAAQGKDKKQEMKWTIQQEPGFQIGDPPPPDSVFQIALPAPGQDMLFAAPQIEFFHNEFMFEGKVVENAPYSADVITETIQTLGDGNRIVRNSTAKAYRDSAGRTRREQVLKVGPIPGGHAGTTLVNINDPVAGLGYMLDSNTKTAHKLMPPPPPPGLKAKMKEKVTWKTDSGADTAAAGAGVATIAVAGAVAGAPVAGIFAPGVPAGNGVIAWPGGAEVNQESLGTQTIEGVMAEGTRITHTIPAGKIGNDRAIVTVSERWYSPELQVIVLSKTRDPRIGETTYRLTNIVRSEPDPALFQVPADYKVESKGFGFRIGPHEPPKIEPKN